MIANTDGLAGRVAQLRTSFDRSFAEPARTAAQRMEHVLAIQVRGRRYAVRLSEVAGVLTGWSVAPVPGPRSDLLGVAGHRGELVPVYDLAALLGSVGDASQSRRQPPDAAGDLGPAADAAGPDRVRWAMLAAGSEPVAFAFDRPDGHRRMSPDVLPAPGSSGPIWTVVETDGETWTVIALARLVGAIQPDRAGGPPPPAQDTGR